MNERTIRITAEALAILIDEIQEERKRLGISTLSIQSDQMMTLVQREAVLYLALKEVRKILKAVGVTE